MPESKIKKRNIVLCSDGTGNQGGTTPDSNVFKIYNAVKINSQKNETEQITFYDNGVGTSKISIMKALGGGMGVGFKQNVRDLYEFLGRNYKEGDDIYIFGFSRGAATVRAFAGMIEHCGLVVKRRIKEADRSEEEFQGLINRAMNAYEKGKLIKFPDGKIQERNYTEAKLFREDKAYRHSEFAPKGKLKIEFMGIWDTVSSLGVPQLGNFDLLVNKRYPHLFYDFEPKDRIKNIYHAIAVDDERLTFRPMVWDETNFNGGGTIEQVWFPGMHSNVGGGYDRQELATVTLDWIIEKLSDHKDSSPPNGGLVLKPSAIDDAKSDANPFGKLHDSRSGSGIFYRYQPRNIMRLCANRLKGQIKIHNSVFKRIKFRTGGYAPLSIPEPKEFEVVYTRNGGSPSNSLQNNSTDEAGTTKEYTDLRKKFDIQIEKRKKLYWLFLKSTLLLLIVSFIEWMGSAKKPKIQIDQGQNVSVFENLTDGSWWSKLINDFTSGMAHLTDWSLWLKNLTDWNWWFGLLIGFINCSLEHIADVLNYFLPDFFEGIITLGVINQPWLFLILICYSWGLWSYRSNILNKMKVLKEDARLELLKLMEPSKKQEPSEG